MEFSRRDIMVGAGAVATVASTMGSFPALAQAGTFKIGVYISEQDAQGVDELVTPYMDQLRYGVELAVAEINATGGVGGRQLELVYRNDLGSPPSVDSVTELVSTVGVEAIVAGFVQASPRLISTRSPSPVPVLMGFWTDGTYCGPVAKHFGPTVMQVVPTVRDTLNDDLETRPFTITNWTPSGRAVSSYLYGALGAAHVGDALVTTPVLGSHAGDFRGVIRWANDMEANIIWTAEPRPYSVNVVNQAVELGLAEGKTFAYVDFSEIQLAQLAAGASIVSCVPFVSSDPSPAVQDFVSRIKAAGASVVTHVAFTHYNAIMGLKAAIERSGDATAAGAIAGFEGGFTLDTATGPVTLEPSGYTTMPMFVVSANGGGTLDIVQKIDSVASSAAC
jgi:branched-chain amino acid transport system substrate-binding protein